MRTQEFQDMSKINRLDQRICSKLTLYLLQVNTKKTKRTVDVVQMNVIFVEGPQAVLNKVNNHQKFL